jgi:hypothetical protein
MKNIKVWASGLISVWFASVVWADLAVITPSGRNLAPGQLALEFENQQAKQGDLRYYMFRYGVNENLEVSTITLDEDFDEGGDQKTMVNLQYQHTPESPYAPGLSVGIWDVQDQDDEGLGRSYYLATERTVEQPNAQVVEHFGYAWSGHSLNGFFGGMIYRTAQGYELAVEHSPRRGTNVQGRYNLSDQFQLRAGSFDGDFTFGLLFQTPLREERRSRW